MKSSTIFKKYLNPSKEETDIGPHISICTKSKHLEETKLLIEKGSLHCLAKWKVCQREFLLNFIMETLCDIVCKTSVEGCPKRWCHKVESTLSESFKLAELQVLGCVWV